MWVSCLILLSPHNFPALLTFWEVTPQNAAWGTLPQLSKLSRIKCASTTATLWSFSYISPKSLEPLQGTVEPISVVKWPVAAARAMSAEIEKLSSQLPFCCCLWPSSMQVETPQLPDMSSRQHLSPRTFSGFHWHSRNMVYFFAYCLVCAS